MGNDIMRTCYSNYRIFKEQTKPDMLKVYITVYPETASHSIGRWSHWLAQITEEEGVAVLRCRPHEKHTPNHKRHHKATWKMNRQYFIALRNITYKTRNQNKWNINLIKMRKKTKYLLKFPKWKKTYKRSCKKVSLTEETKQMGQANRI
jgi:hypothetical protein